MRISNQYIKNPERVILFLEAFRKSLIHIGILIFSLTLIGLYFASSTLRYLKTSTGVKLAAFGVPDAFLAFVTTAVGLGLFAAMPYISFSILSAMPLLSPSFSRKMKWAFWTATILLFYSGAFFCILITLPYGAQFLLSYATERIEPIISVIHFVSFSFVFIFGFGMIFNLPLVMILLGRVGLVRRETWTRYRRYAILGITVISAILTPTPDVFNLMLMAVPLYILFELGIFGMRLWKK
ncbi:MAG: twin-arginine translocase subunit TatC [Proteobacteria bacterium]|nr:twin-arginine translocase subunit TatC [Pseudomonadota bacterium]